MQNIVIWCIYFTKFEDNYYNLFKKIAFKIVKVVRFFLQCYQRCL